MIRTLVAPCHRRPAARLALLAMWLLVAGPLLGQLSAAEQGRHVGHPLRHPGEQHHLGGHPPGPMASTAEAPATVSTATALHRQVACGYCMLFQQMPVLSAMLPRLVPVPSPAITAPVVATRAAHGGPAVFPQAPTRAPPNFRS